MSIFVVDASVVVKWFVPEVHSREATRLLSAAHQYVAPDLLFAETANAIWKKTGRGEMTAPDSRRLVAAIDNIAIETISCRALATDAHALAILTGRTVYDAMYLALALRLDTHVITADDRLLAGLQRFPALATHVEHVRDFGV